MSRQLLKHLNGNQKGKLFSFLNNFKGEPRIAWYPSAGEDFRALLYLHQSFSELHPAAQKEPAPPDLFLFSDYFPWKHSTFLDNRLLYSDGRTTIVIEHIEELPRLGLLPLSNELVHFPEGSHATDRAVFLMIKITSDKLGEISYPVIYAFAENEKFYCKKLVPTNSSISHVIHVRYGGGFGGGNASGVWLINVLKQLHCELYITDGHGEWQSGDEFAVKFCSSIPRESDVVLTPIRTVQSQGWSGHGDVTWNLVS